MRLGAYTRTEVKMFQFAAMVFVRRQKVAMIVTIAERGTVAGVTVGVAPVTRIFLNTILQARIARRRSGFRQE